MAPRRFRGTQRWRIGRSRRWHDGGQRPFRLVARCYGGAGAVKLSTVAIAAAVLVVPIASGCSDPGGGVAVATSTVASAPATASLSLRTVCDALRDFFAGDLQVVDTQLQQTALDGPVRVGATCTLRQGEAEVGRFSSRPDETANPTENLRGFDKVIELEQPVLVFDHRVEDPYGPSTVILATRVDSWIGRLDIKHSGVQASTGSLDLTKDDLKKAARFLIDTTTRLNAGQ